MTRFTEATTKDSRSARCARLEFEGAHGETVQMFVVLPPGFDAKQKYPLVQVIHGGPHGISGDQFHSALERASCSLRPGYVVAMVNFQGSTSWGQDFAQRIQGALGRPSPWTT